MKIAIICDPVDLDQKTGIPVYCEQMVREFMKDATNQYVFFHMKENPIFNGFENVVFPSGQTFWIKNAIRNLWRKFYLMPREFRRRNIQIVHELNTIGSHIFDPFRKYRSIITVYDLTPVLFRQHHWFLTVLAFNLFVNRSASKADAVIAISEATKTDLVSEYGIPKEKVRVTLLWSKITDVVPADSPKYDFPFILSVGTLEPRKNVRNLIRAFVQLKETGKYPDVKLVLTGKKGWKTESIFTELSLNAAYADDIVMTGFLSDEQLVRLYNDCAVFAYPSIYEGFWLPVLEAMSLGAPVVTSNVSSLPEVAWDACLMVDPHDVGEIAEAIGKILDNEGLRKELAQKWLEQAKRFSWKKCAEETVAIYGSLER